MNTAMKKIIIPALFMVMSLFGVQTYAQTTNQQQQAPRQANESAGDRPIEEIPPVSEKDDVDAGLDATRSIMELSSEDHELSFLIDALEFTGLHGAMHAAGPYTIFAPVDAAFNKIPHDELESLMTEENKERLMTLLGYHIVRGNINTNDLEDGQRLTSITGRELIVRKTLTDITIDGARIMTPNIKATNGKMHKVDSVILPPHRVR